MSTEAKGELSVVHEGARTMDTESKGELSIVGVGEIGELIGLQQSTVYVMSSLGKLPEPDTTVNRGGTKIWHTATILEWDANRRKR